MKDTASRIADAWKGIRQGHEIIAKALAAIHYAQEECDHNWRFSRQVNNFHDEIWLVTYKCSVCGKEHTDAKPPVCPDDDTPLVRADEVTHMHDAFICPKCCGVQILPLLGD